MGSMHYFFKIIIIIAIKKLYLLSICHIHYVNTWSASEGTCAIKCIMVAAFTEKKKKRKQQDYDYYYTMYYMF